MRTIPPPSGRNDNATVPVSDLVAKVPERRSPTRTPAIGSPESKSNTPSAMCDTR
ncbi:MAG TPA: hypothetical protein VGM50_17790 [Gemmatimonadaceae bacterium]|jgi:hypothetical protein